MSKNILKATLVAVSLAGTILATTGSAEARLLGSHVARAPQSSSGVQFNCPRCNDHPRPATNSGAHLSQWGSGNNSHYGWGKNW